MILVYQALTGFITGAGLLACFFFVVRYWWVTRGAWIHEEPGRFFMSFMAILGLLFGIVLSGLIWHNPTIRRWVALAAYALFVGLTWWPLRLLLIAQREKVDDNAP